jgi:hypothetical protein
MSPEKEKGSSKKPEKEKKVTAPKTPKGTRLPILWETVNTLSRIIITLTGIGVAVMSYFHGSNFLMCAVRAGAAMVSIGLLFWMIYWMITRGTLDLMHSLYDERQQELKKNSSPNSTMEFNG